MTARRLLVAGVAAGGLLTATAPPSPARPLRISEFRLSASALGRLRDHWVNRLLATHRAHTWAPMKISLTNADLRLMGLPPKRFLLGRRFPVPTAVFPDGRMVRLAAGKGKPGGGGANTSAPATATFAGTGFFGVRPGAWLLTVTDQ